MGFQDRNYYHKPQGFGSGGGFGGGGMPQGGMGIFLPKITPMVKYLLIINIAVFFLQSVQPGSLEKWFAASGGTYIEALQVWRLVTFQFLHGNTSHLVFNMLGLYFLGTILERSWGSKQFLYFYLISGAVGGGLFVAANTFGVFGVSYLVGASGGILALLMACAILFPHIKVLLFFIVPVNIRVIAAALAGIYFFSVLRDYNAFGSNAGGNLCHLGGMATGFVWVMGRGRLTALWRKHQTGAYQRKLEQVEKTQFDVDRILAKVHQQGLQSLSRKEKQILQKATEHQKKH